MPKAHQLHLDTIAAKLRDRGIDPADALEAIEAGQPFDPADAALAGLRQIRDALGAQWIRDALR